MPGNSNNNKGGGSKIDGVYSNLRDRILAGEYAVGVRLPTEAELEQIFGVSRGTVRYALSRLDADGLIYRKRSSGSYVSPRSKVRRVIVVTNYPSDAAPNDFGQMYGAHIFGLGMNARLVEDDCNCFRMTISFDKYLAIYNGLHLVYRDVAAVIFFRRIDPLHESAKYLRKHQIPFLFYGSGEYDLTDVENHLTYDYRELFDLAVGCLLEHGHHEIAYVHDNSPPARIEMLEKLLGERKDVARSAAFHVNGLSVENVRLEFKGFSAVFCLTDRVALKVVNTLVLAGVKVPEDVSVVSIDNYPVCENAIVPITSVDIPLKDDGLACMRFVDDTVNGKPAKLPKRSKVSLVMRETVRRKSAAHK